MTVEILKRERCGNGWYRFKGAVNGVVKVKGVDVGVRLPAAYVESVSASEADAEVKDQLKAEFTRLMQGSGGTYVP